ncbi:MAG TPA: acyl-CoA synthetase FdrA [Burkholderiales bacterium]
MSAKSAGGTLVNSLRRGFYADSVALMRIARALGAAPGVLQASLMIGSDSNKALLADSGLLAPASRAARADDLVIALRARTPAQAKAALKTAAQLLAGDRQAADTAGTQGVPGLGVALETLPQANLALISVPGEFAAREARRALERGLHVMIFSDNVPVAEEVALKRFAVSRGLLAMGPDCGTALIGGVPLAFANAVPRGAVGLISASGTGLQEVSCLLARAGHGVSHGIGVGGRDLSLEVDGLMTFAAFDALERDPATKRIILISKPPAAAVAAKVIVRAARCAKPVVLCLLGAPAAKLPRGVRMARTLEEAALGAAAISRTPKTATPRSGWIRGLFSGGTLAAEAQVVLMDAGVAVRSNAPVPGATACAAARGAAHTLIDLGDDEYTRGRPHPMIDPELRMAELRRVLRAKDSAAVLLDVVIGYGAHADPAGGIAAVLREAGKNAPPVIASVTGTDADPQHYARQVETLRAAGVTVAASNAAAARRAAQCVRAPRVAAKRSARR